MFILIQAQAVLKPTTPPLTAPPRLSQPEQLDLVDDVPDIHYDLDVPPPPPEQGLPIRAPPPGSPPVDRPRRPAEQRTGSKGFAA